ncbi:STAS domain-containing protein [Actinomycetospora sp. C-140]
MSEPSGVLRVDRTSHADQVVLIMHGELASDTLPVAQDEVTAAEADAPPVLVLDLAPLDYVDSSGVRLVLLAQHVAEEAGRRLAVRLGRGHTRRVFDMLGLTSRLEVLDRDDAS